MEEIKIKKYEIELDETKQNEIREDISTLFNVDKININDNEDYEMIAEILKSSKGKQKEIKGFYKEPKDVAHKAHKEICDMEKEDLTILTRFEDLSKKEMTKYLLEIEEKKEEQEKNENKEDIEIEIPKVQGVSVSNKFDYEIENQDLLPRDFLIPNEKMIRDAINSSNGTIEIPGVKIIKDKIISVRAD